MSATLLALLLQVPAATLPTGSPWPTGQTAPVANAGVQREVYVGGIEAAQPIAGQSSSSVVTRPRIDPQLARGSDGSLSVRVRDLARVRGQEDNIIHGIGLVTGLAASGDSGLPARQAIANLLKTKNINIEPSQLATNNVAVVWLEATLPPGVKPGSKLDGRASSIYDAESLVGGTLVWGELTDPTGRQVYATASGPVSVGGFSAGGDGASAVRNHLTVGIMPDGVKVEREVPTKLVMDQGYLYLDLKAKTGSFGNAVRISDRVNEMIPGIAVPMDGMSVRVEVPGWVTPSEEVRFLSSILELGVQPEASSRVVINERTGVIVLGEEVRLTRGAITKGNLTVTIAESPEVSQPAPLSEGETTVVPRTNLLIEEEQRALSIINGAASLQEVVEVLNVLGVSPRDMIEILQSMAQSGMLHADLVIQ
ncbi:flagellar basal body P-ring protein FlgI [Engelhardtia mirabilis]|uniref:Flagellar P-ring protein n=1 Tax=Engelhardtia mirabilis TaxID=2528011 RepID=A0A518BSY4_9BACT|nr:Flagellar P-ring protein precursor [Planctomycetes bacterium Pla133]QDV04406.1 Flagellar P-ring protein precursor [Planctomycetes bacterium Pla86]